MVTRTDYALTQRLQALLELVADCMTDLQSRGIAVTFSLNTGTSPVAVVGFAATKAVQPEPVTPVAEEAKATA